MSGNDPSGVYPEDGIDELDDMAVWRRALTAYEAYAIYHAATNSNNSFDVPGTVTLQVAKSGTNVVVSWRPGATLGTLQQSDNPAGPWTNVSGVYAPQYTVAPTAFQRYFRLLVN
jgi:hypothetical protein